MSYATTIRGTGASRRSTRTKAAPKARATSALSWSGTVPRTSYALTKRLRSDTVLTPPLPGSEAPCAEPNRPIVINLSGWAAFRPAGRLSASLRRPTMRPPYRSGGTEMPEQVIHQQRLAWDGARVIVRALESDYLYRWLNDELGTLLGRPYQQALSDSFNRLWWTERLDAPQAEAGPVPGPAGRPPPAAAGPAPPPPQHSYHTLA